MAHIAEGAAARALVAHDHEGGSAFAKAFTNVGAAGFFADSDQLVLAQDVFDFVKPCGRRACFDANPFRLFQDFAWRDFDGDA